MKDWKKEFEEKFAGQTGYCNPIFSKKIQAFIESLLAKERENIWKEVSDLWQRGEFNTKVLANKLRALKDKK